MHETVKTSNALIAGKPVSKAKKSDLEALCHKVFDVDRERIHVDYDPTTGTNYRDEDKYGLGGMPTEKTNLQNFVSGLKHSISTHGIIDPLLVRLVWNNNDWYFAIIKGHRRMKSTDELRLLPEFASHFQSIPVMLLPDGMSDEEIQRLTADHGHRKDLTESEKLTSVRKQRDAGIILQDIANGFGQKLSWAQRRNNLLQMGPEIIALYVASARGEKNAVKCNLTMTEQLYKDHFKIDGKVIDWSQSESDLKNDEQAQGFHAAIEAIKAGTFGKTAETAKPKPRTYKTLEARLATYRDCQPINQIIAWAMGKDRNLGDVRLAIVKLQDDSEVLGFVPESVRETARKEQVKASKS